MKTYIRSSESRLPGLKLLKAIRLVLFLAAGISISISACQKKADQIFYYAGCNDGRIERSIYLCSLDYGNGQTEVVDSFAGSIGSSYLALSPGVQYLYAVDRSHPDKDSDLNSVSSFRIDAGDLTLKFLNRQSSEGYGPCYVSCSDEGDYLFVANYSGGSVGVMPLSDSGEIRPASDVARTVGSGPNTQRQESSHPHSARLTPDGKFVLVPDLGSDRVRIYRFDKAAGKLIPNSIQEFLATAPGAGPRHLDFHPNGTFLYLINELNGTLTACDFDTATGEIRILNTLSTLPDTYTGFNKSAAVHVRPDGKFVYASNRGDENSIGVFSINDDGSITRVEVYTDVPDFPRDFNIDPTGKYLLVAGQGSNEIKVYNLDSSSGKLSPSGGRLEIPAPSNIVFVKQRP